MNLKQMTLEELWELFPITLLPYNPVWKKWAEDEINLLQKLLIEYSPTFHHIGSTAIPGIKAKPITDILVELPSIDNWNQISNLMEENGYIEMARSENRMSFNKGYTPEGYDEKVFHIHFRRSGDNDEVYFRNYLLNHPEEAKEYEKLKESLLSRFKNNRDAYTEAKLPFVNYIRSKIVL